MQREVCGCDTQREIAMFDVMRAQAFLFATHRITSHHITSHHITSHHTSAAHGNDVAVHPGQQQQQQQRAAESGWQ